MTDQQVDVVFCPDKGMIACVLLQAAYRCNSSIPVMFDTSDWLTTPCEGMVKMSATRKEWRFIADMTRDERIERWRKISTRLRPTPSEGEEA